MFIKLTNAVDGREDDPIYINTNHIICVFEDKTDGGSLVTRVYGGPNGTTWTVQESLGQVIKAIEAQKKNCSCQ